MLGVLLFLGLGASGAATKGTQRINQRQWSEHLPAEGYQGTVLTAQATYHYGRHNDQFVLTAWGEVCEAMPKGALVRTPYPCRSPRSH